MSDGRRGQNVATHRAAKHTAAGGTRSGIYVVHLISLVDLFGQLRSSHGVRTCRRTFGR